MSAISEYYELQVLLAVRQTIHANRSMYDRAEMKFSPVLMESNIRNRIKVLRRAAREVNHTAAKTIEISAIKGKIDKTLNDYKRTGVNVKVGKEVSGYKSKAKRGSYSDVTVTVGYMWARKVWKNLHSHDTDKPEVLLLKADELRVNNPRVRLYEATALNMKSGEVEKGYVGQCAADNRWKFSPTIRLAASWAENAYQHAVDEKITGEGKE